MSCVKIAKKFVSWLIIKMKSNTQQNTGGAMLHQVVIKDPSGKVKKIISAEEISKKHWIDFKLKELTTNKKKIYKNKVKQNWVCETCKKIFRAARDRKFCHDPCGYVDKRHSPMGMKPCGVCKKEFMPNSNVQKYCYNPCDKNLAKKLRDENGKESKANSQQIKKGSSQTRQDNNLPA